jgi:hypothetical protein
VALGTGHHRSKYFLYRSGIVALDRFISAYKHCGAKSFAAYREYGRRVVTIRPLLSGWSVDNNV